MFTRSFNLSCHLQHVQQVCSEVLTRPAASTRKYGFARELSGNLDAPGWARYALPYAIESLDAEGLRLIVLNRDYKPVGLGIPYSLHVDYAQFDAWQVQGDQALQVHAADCWRHSSKHHHWLFSDGCAPWSGKRELRDYMNRMTLLREALAPECIAA